MIRLVAVVLFLSACGGGGSAKKPDAQVQPDGMLDASGCGDCDAPLDANPLDDLLGTGLCMDKACTQFSAGVKAYTPRFALWADDASKRRWLALPTGSTIDTSDMDHWKFPQGTKLWKEFTTDGADGSARVETRYITKVGPGDDPSDWFMVAYEWNATNDDATAVPFGANNANGTQHDIPSQAQCRACHESLQPTRVLGVGAIQLDYANPTTGEVDLDTLIASGTLTVNPPGATSPHYPLPSDSNNTYATDALGYMHANCGHCHNPTSQVYQSNMIYMNLRLDVASLGTVGATGAYTTAVGQDANFPLAGHTKRVVAGDPSTSIMIDRFESTNSALWMPALGHKTMDPTGDTLLKNWITHLQ